MNNLISRIDNNTNYDNKLGMEASDHEVVKGKLLNEIMKSIIKDFINTEKGNDEKKSINKNKDDDNLNRKTKRKTVKLFFYFF